MPGSVFRSERFVISVECGSLRRKIFQCQFAKRDGSVFVNFPYFRHSEGALARVARVRLASEPLLTVKQLAVGRERVSPQTRSLPNLDRVLTGHLRVRASPRAMGYFDST
jgi:hypothetical protein